MFISASRRQIKLDNLLSEMLILPSSWQWPKELTHITKAYTTFGEWGANYTNSSWLDSKVTENVVSSFEVTSNGQNTYVVK